jgi:RNA recognition motif-containing protein
MRLSVTQLYRIAYKHQKKHVLYVQNLSWITGKPHIESYFSQFGDVSDVSFRLNENGMHNGYAFVRFANEDAMKRAVHTKDHQLDSHSLTVRPKETEEDLKQRKKTR